ncbi:MAG: hypothetical protein J2P44_06885, partial [Candidatus Dormibacteraeota bacterium]|nr:hypothetical protein [Candidatus Dormibacteraeota bacterium]
PAVRGTTSPEPEAWRPSWEARSRCSGSSNSDSLRGIAPARPASAGSCRRSTSPGFRRVCSTRISSPPTRSGRRTAGMSSSIGPEPVGGPGSGRLVSSSTPPGGGRGWWSLSCRATRGT